MNSGTLKIERRAPSGAQAAHQVGKGREVALLTLSNPGKRNALDPERRGGDCNEDGPPACATYQPADAKEHKHQIWDESPQCKSPQVLRLRWRWDLR